MQKNVLSIVAIAGLSALGALVLSNPETRAKIKQGASRIKDRLAATAAPEPART